jgi:hypothetical protein
MCLDASPELMIDGAQLQFVLKRAAADIVADGFDAGVLPPSFRE